MRWNSVGRRGDELNNVHPRGESAILSVIIPVGPQDRAWHDLLPDLIALPPRSEVILAFPEESAPNLEGVDHEAMTLRISAEGNGRAEQMNAAARSAEGRFLWFLHADSRLPKGLVDVLANTIARDPDDLIYFDLAFSPDATRLMKINEIGVWFRSHFLKSPFGDQGFCVRKTSFASLGGFPEETAYGEDHVFVWRWRQSGRKLRAAGVRIFTSARKYRRNGWLKTTFLHQRLWLEQAFPECMTLMAKRLARQKERSQSSPKQ